MLNREELLRIKLAANQQRLLRQEYLAALPESLGTYLEKCPFTQSPELDEIVSIFHISPNGIVRNAMENENIAYLNPEGYHYREFSWLNQLFDFATSVSDWHDQKMASLYPFAGPLYHVPFGWVRKNIYELFTCEWLTQDFGIRYKYRPESLGVVTLDYTVGLVLDNHCGYLEEDPNPDEIVYELAVWGFD